MYLGQSNGLPVIRWNRQLVLEQTLNYVCFRGRGERQEYACEADEDNTQRWLYSEGVTKFQGEIMMCEHFRRFVQTNLLSRCIYVICLGNSCKILIKMRVARMRHNTMVSVQVRQTRSYPAGIRCMPIYHV